ncbi:Lrp/AsnC family transcriptional regulator [Propionimicrobium sp. PCR01-08-3]|uniref:Lrp/AsnC family transcriptional regulator n=1 Tax=Propionimicrobium sp. PCR01-08-3 TaxID=3052086 RepID=UPI00255C6DE2|nr:Lrp/AsnC family transcriptional regulator [Propionimicrobium sp. PCR01-08-3]WIY82743.1 Lrp/AsnC family transcriptional regulator [Propionimicrobium sp. PCR01-08-3]
MSRDVDHARAKAPKDPRHLDATDHLILHILMARGRIPNSTLAQAVSVAESTAHARVRALMDSGIIRGVHADFDLSALGRPLEALVQVQIQRSSRDKIKSEALRLAERPGVIAIDFLGGDYDLLVRIAAKNSADLSDFVLNELNAHPEIAKTKTLTVLEHFRGRQPFGAPT